MAESWAYYYGRILADRVYLGLSSTQFEQGIEYTNGSIFENGFFIITTGLNAHLNLLEDWDPLRTNDPFRWIPQGIYYDMIDNRNDLIIQFPRVLIDDNVSNYTNLQFFNALDIDIVNLSAYRLRLLQESGNNQSGQVTNLFSAYGY